ncbi:MAG: hypothetical protein LBD57_04270 [Endomicrobium sp.]|jgi:uracil DNA glycosylase|uniref:HK97 gp10 family phage protein n=1 Tax=Candidatus Endomicrobiellum cubanum TaxID=3242325 RepID=UPI002839128D|nr:hypothetical protein [Endomicrobium sp.]
MIKVSVSGSYKNLKQSLGIIAKIEFRMKLKKWATAGVQALEKATPKDTGLTAKSWRYEIREDATGTIIDWHNDNISKGTPVAIFIQYGHVTMNGSFVDGVDYINPALQPIFKEITTYLNRM